MDNNKFPSNLFVPTEDREVSSHWALDGPRERVEMKWSLVFTWLVLHTIIILLIHRHRHHRAPC